MISKDDEELRTHLRTFLRERMEQLHFTEADLARATGDRPNQIYRAVNGLHTPSLAFAVRLAKALKCSVDELSGINAFVS